MSSLSSGSLVTVGGGVLRPSSAGNQTIGPLAAGGAAGIAGAAAAGGSGQSAQGSSFLAFAANAPLGIFVIATDTVSTSTSSSTTP
jgi:hypothetical protein